MPWNPTGTKQEIVTSWCERQLHLPIVPTLPRPFFLFLSFAPGRCPLWYVDPDYATPEKAHNPKYLSAVDKVAELMAKERDKYSPGLPIWSVVHSVSLSASHILCNYLKGEPLCAGWAKQQMFPVVAP